MGARCGAHFRLVGQPNFISITLMKEGVPMNEKQTPNEGEESTYTLLVRSEERKRGIFEMIIYSLMILSAIAAILQFAHQRDSLPLAGLPESAAVYPLAQANQS